MTTYPVALGHALFAGLWEAGFALEVARKAESRADTTYVAGWLFRAVLLFAHALHGRAGRCLINERARSPPPGACPQHRPASPLGLTASWPTSVTDPTSYRQPSILLRRCSTMSAPSAIRPCRRSPQ